MKKAASLLSSVCNLEPGLPNCYYADCDYEYSLSILIRIRSQKHNILAHAEGCSSQHYVVLRNANSYQKSMKEVTLQE